MAWCAVPSMSAGAVAQGQAPPPASGPTPPPVPPGPTPSPTPAPTPSPTPTPKPQARPDVVRAPNAARPLDLKVMSEKVARYPGVAFLRNELGNLLAQKGRLGEAAEQYRTAVEIQPE